MFKMCAEKVPQAIEMSLSGYSEEEVEEGEPFFVVSSSPSLFEPCADDNVTNSLVRRRCQ